MVLLSCRISGMLLMVAHSNAKIAISLTDSDSAARKDQCWLALPVRHHGHLPAPAQLWKDGASRTRKFSMSFKNRLALAGLCLALVHASASSAPTLADVERGIVPV